MADQGWLGLSLISVSLSLSLSLSLTIQLRGKQGNLLTPTEEAERFRTYCEQIYKLPTSQLSSTTVEPSSVPTPPLHIRDDS